MRAETLVQMAGLHSLGFAAFHLAFWRLFGWKHELRKVGLPTRAVTQILNLRLIYVFLGAGAVCFLFTHDLLRTSLGRALLGFMALFWLGRTIEQLVFLRINDPRVHVLTVLFVAGAVLFAAPLLID